MKKIIYIIMCALGLIGLVSLYVLVCLVHEEDFNGLRHIVIIIGYISVILFGGGFLLLIANKKEKDDKNVNN